MMKKFLVATAVATAVVATVSMAAGPARADDITIAVAGPMTGQLAAFGEQLRRGSEMAVKDINAAGGVMGKQINLVVGDDDASGHRRRGRDLVRRARRREECERPRVARRQCSGDRVEGGPGRNRTCHGH